MTVWSFLVVLDCGHRNRGQARETPNVGDPWTCFICGKDTTVKREMGHGA